jgi:hypothetical protein
MFQHWDCSMFLGKTKISDDTTSRTVSMGNNVSRDGCSTRLFGVLKCLPVLISKAYFLAHKSYLNGRVMIEQRF